MKLSLVVRRWSLATRRRLLVVGKKLQEMSFRTALAVRNLQFGSAE